MGMRSASLIMRRSARRTRSKLEAAWPSVVVASVVLSFLLDACAALEANKVIHRDVKASNILVEPSQKRLVLIDFGSAMDVDTKQGYEAESRRSHPDTARRNNSSSWSIGRAFDAYGCGLVALRLLLSRLYEVRTTSTRSTSSSRPPATTWIGGSRRNSRRPRCLSAYSRRCPHYAR